MRAALPAMNLYPDGNTFYLKQKLAAKLNLMPANLILGNGSNEVLEMVGTRCSLLNLKWWFPNTVLRSIRLLQPCLEQNLLAFRQKIMATISKAC